MNIFDDHPCQEPVVVVTVSKWGNSLGVRLPRGIAEDARLSEGSVVDVRVEKGNIILEPVSAPSLDDLLKRVTDSNRHGDILPATPTGRESL